jgi:uncharacterized protein
MPRQDRRPPVVSAEMLADDGRGDRIDFERGLQYAAPATLAVIAACCAAFCWQMAAGILAGESSVIRGGALVRDHLLGGEVWRLVTSMFLHGGIGHLVGNMVPLFILGIACEHAFNAKRLLGIYLATGVTGGVVSTAVEPAATVNASGAIFGLMGCLVAMLRRHARRVQVRDGRVGAVVGLWALWQMAIGFTEPLIANFAHVGGFVAGALLGTAVSPNKLLARAAAWAFAAPLALAAVGAHAAGIEGPRPATAVFDETGILGKEDVDHLESLAASVRRASGADVMVVVIPSTDGQPHRSFATDLFNRWKLGSEDRDDGLLIFVALNDRKAEIVLGDGIDGLDQIEASQRIMKDVLIPEFKRGRPEAGLRKAAFACATEILSAPAENSLPLLDEPGRAPTVDNMPAQRVMRAPVRARRPPEDSVFPYAVGGGGALGGVGLGWYLVRRRLRNRPRRCPACGIDMVRLGELADDAHLSTGQRMEERLRSVDYDVWTCPTCPQVNQFRYGAFFTRYARCPSCRHVTKSKTVNRVQRPTKWHSGLEKITERCGQCGYANESTRVLPQLDDDSSSSSWSSSSSGGGSSSGAGASGSW